ncbi:Hsp20/alpha crystallin family protein [Archangium gephyra]|uniref:Hsp20/alpha crystallin family protein n=1 Tax=Archangium gephyra TaxID=48 RepID=UPI0035D415D8
MSGASRWWDSAREWVGKLPSGLSGEVTVDVGRKRLRLSHARVEALARRALRDVKALSVGDWVAGPQTYDVRLEVSGWKLRVEVALERLELASGRYHLTLRTPGRVDLEESRAASALVQGVLRLGGGKAALRTVLDQVMPKGLSWDGQRLQVSGALPKEGAVPARLFESSSLAVNAEHDSEGVWLSAEAWPGLVDLMQAMLSVDLPRKPPGT